MAPRSPKRLQLLTQCVQARRHRRRPGRCAAADRPRTAPRPQPIDRAIGSRPRGARDFRHIRACRPPAEARAGIAHPGQKEFWGLSLQVTPDVLVPRPETETVIEGALDFVVRGGLRMEKLRILDIGTGSGALLLALLHELPNAAGTGTDISAAALDVARANAAQCGLESRCNFVACDIAADVQGHSILSSPTRPTSRTMRSRRSRRRCGTTIQKLHSMAAATGLLATAPLHPRPGAFWHRADDYLWNWARARKLRSARYLPMRINRRCRTQGFGRDSTRDWRRSSAMNGSHSHPMKIAELDYRRKKALGLWFGND